MADPYDDAALHAHETNDRLWGGIYEEARRRLRTDPLLSARVKATTGLLLHELRSVRGSTFDQHDDAVAGLAAAVALVIAERPELITGQPTDRQDPGKVLAGILAPLLLGLGGQLSRTLGDGWQDAEGLARRLLESLEAAGWEVTWRADRFATIQDGGRRVRIPTGGRCRTCYLDVERAVEVNDGEVLVDHWRHVDTRAPHRDDAITDVEPR